MKVSSTFMGLESVLSRSVVRSEVKMRLLDLGLLPSVLRKASKEIRGRGIWMGDSMAERLLPDRVLLTERVLASTPCEHLEIRSFSVSSMMVERPSASTSPSQSLLEAWPHESMLSYEFIESDSDSSSEIQPQSP